MTCKLNQKGVLKMLKEMKQYPIDKFKLIVHEAGIKTAEAYILERSGAI